MMRLDYLTRNHSIPLERSIYFGLSEADVFCTETNDVCSMRPGIHIQLYGKYPGLISRRKIKMWSRQCMFMVYIFFLKLHELSF